MRIYIIYFLSALFLIGCNQKTNNEKAVKKLSEKEYSYYKVKADMYYESDKYEKALTCLNYLIKIDSVNPEFYFKRAYCKNMLYMFDEGLLDYNKAIKYNYINIDAAYFNMGNTYMIKYSFNDAINCYSKAIEYNPKDTSSYLRRGEAKIGLKDFSGACNDFKKAIKLGNNSKLSWMKVYCNDF